MIEGASLEGVPHKQPWGLRWRSSVNFVTFVVTLGVLTDILVYSLIIPVIPYQLKALGYDGIGAKVSWLLVAFSGALILATPPIAHCSEVYRNRKIPLLAGLVALIGSQGVNSTVIWTVGSALVCDTVPEKSLGRQLGIVSMGVTIGNLIAPPVAGVLYQRWGFRAPFIFGIVATAIDLLARLLLIERHEAMRWGVDPMAVAISDKVQDLKAAPEVIELRRTEKLTDSDSKPVTQESGGDSLVYEGESWTDIEIGGKAKESNLREEQLRESKQARVTSLPHIVLLKLVKSPRAIVCLVLSVFWGFGWVAQETTVVLHMNKVWGLDSRQAGIAFIAAIVPTIFSTVLAGWLGDKYGSAPVGCAILLLSLPWYGLLTLEGPLTVFLIFFALEAFFASSLISILMLELSCVGSATENIGYAHIYGAFILAYGIGATAGPVMAGQIYDHVERGWLVVQLTATGCAAVGFILALFMLGERPLALRFFQIKKH